VSVKVHRSSKMEPIGVGMLSTIARTVARIAFSSQSKRMRKPSNKPCCALAWSVVACVEVHVSLPWRGKPVRAGSKRTSRTCLLSKKPFCLRHRMTFSNWMRIWSVVRKKDHQRWLWTAMCHRTRQIVGFAIGDRSKATCLCLWESIPDEYKHCHTFSDCWRLPTRVPG
jgi:hypothetical protein